MGKYNNLVTNISFALHWLTKNYTTNIIYNRDSVFQDRRNNMKEKEKEIKGRNDYKWHPKLTTTQIDEFWAEGILPGSQEYRMKLANFGIKEEISVLEENSEDIKVDLDINKKTGVCKIITNDFERQIEMNAADYSRKGLKKFRKDLLTIEDIAKEDQKYIKNIDPTIYKAYLEYDYWAREDSDAPSASKMYVNSVIQKSKALEQGKINEEVQMPGKINVDIGWHPRMKNVREKTQKFRKIRDFVGNFRANKILKNHGAPGVMAWKKMNIANIVDNRRMIRTLILGMSSIAMLGAAESERMSTVEPAQDTQIEAQGPEKQENVNFDKQAEQDESVNLQEQTSENAEKESDTEFSKKKKNQIYPGDVISAEQYATTFGSTDSKEANGALTTKEMLGVNKIACVIDGETFSSINYSVDEIYEMAKKANVEVRYHVDKAIEMDGKICVQVHEKNNPSPTYVYNDNGIMKTMDGKKWTGDTEYSSVAGWMSEKDIQKANVKVQNKTPENEKNHQKVQEKDKER